MSIFNRRILPVATLLLFAGSAAFAQDNKAAATQDNSKEQRLLAQDPSAYVSEDDSYALPWVPIKESNILFKKRVWRNIDAADNGNKLFAASASANDNALINILLKGAFDGKIKAYDASTAVFGAKVLTKDDLIALITPGAHADKKCLIPAQVTRYQIKEDWLFLEKENKMVVRMLGVAPLIAVKNADGTVSDKPAFWIFYPEARDYLAQCKVANAGGNANWDQVFVNRGFTSKIVNVTNIQPWRPSKQ